MEKQILFQKKIWLEIEYYYSSKLQRIDDVNLKIIQQRDEDSDDSGNPTLSQKLIFEKDNRSLLYVPFSSELTLVKRNILSAEYGVMLENRALYFSFIEDGLFDEFERFCSENHVAIQRVEEDRLRMHGKMETKEKEKAAASQQGWLAETLKNLSEQISMTTDLTTDRIKDFTFQINNLEWNAANHWKQDILKKPIEKPVAIPGFVKGFFSFARSTTGFAAKATNGVLDGVVWVAVKTTAVVTYPIKAVINRVSPAPSASEPEKPPKFPTLSAASSVAGNTIYGVSAVINSVSEARRKLLDDLAHVADDLITYSAGKDVADITKDSVKTLNNGIDVYSNVAGTSVTKFVTRIAEKTATKAAKQSLQEALSFNKSDKSKETTPLVNTNNEKAALA